MNVGIRSQRLGSKETNEMLKMEGNKSHGQMSNGEVLSFCLTSFEQSRIKARRAFGKKFNLVYVYSLNFFASKMAENRPLVSKIFTAEEPKECFAKGTNLVVIVAEVEKVFVSKRMLGNLSLSKFVVALRGVCAL